MSDARSGDANSGEVLPPKPETKSIIDSIKDFEKTVEAPVGEFYDTEKALDESMEKFVEVLSSVEQLQKELKKLNKTNKSKLVDQVKNIPEIITKEEIEKLKEFITTYEKVKSPVDTKVSLVSPQNMQQLNDRLRALERRQRALLISKNKNFAKDLKKRQEEISKRREELSKFKDTDKNPVVLQQEKQLSDAEKSLQDDYDLLASLQDGSYDFISYDYLGEVRLKRFIEGIPSLTSVVGLSEYIAGTASLDKDNSSQLVDEMNKLFSNFDSPMEIGKELIDKFVQTLLRSGKIDWSAYSAEERAKLKDFIAILSDNEYKIFSKEDIETLRYFLEPYRKLNNLFSERPIEIAEAIHDIDGTLRSNEFSNFQKVLAEISGNKAAFEKFLKHLENTYPLIFYLIAYEIQLDTKILYRESIKPIQHYPRYGLKLKEIIDGLNKFKQNLVAQKALDDASQIEGLISVVQRCKQFVDEEGLSFNISVDYLSLQNELIRLLQVFVDTNANINEKQKIALLEAIENLKKVSIPVRTPNASLADLLAKQENWLSEIRAALAPIMTDGHRKISRINLFQTSSAFESVKSSIEEIIAKSRLSATIAETKSLKKAEYPLTEFYKIQNEFHQNMAKFVSALDEIKTNLSQEEQQELDKFLKVYRVLIPNPFGEKPASFDRAIDGIATVIRDPNNQTEFAKEFKDVWNAILEAEVQQLAFQQFLNNINEKYPDIYKTFLSKLVKHDPRTGLDMEQSPEEFISRPYQNSMRYALTLQEIKKSIPVLNPNFGKVDNAISILKLKTDEFNARNKKTLPESTLNVTALEPTDITVTTLEPARPSVSSQELGESVELGETVEGEANVSAMHDLPKQPEVTGITEFYTERKDFRDNINQWIKELIEIRKTCSEEHRVELTLYINLIRKLRSNLFFTQADNFMDGIDKIQKGLISDKFKAWVESLHDYAIAHTNFKRLLEEIKHNASTSDPIKNKIESILSDSTKPLEELSTYSGALLKIKRDIPQQTSESEKISENLSTRIEEIEKMNKTIHEQKINPEREALAYYRSIHHRIVRQLNIMRSEFLENFEKKYAQVQSTSTVDNEADEPALVGEAAEADFRAEVDAEHNILLGRIMAINLALKDLEHPDSLASYPFHSRKPSRTNLSSPQEKTKYDIDRMRDILKRLRKDKSMKDFEQSMPNEKNSSHASLGGVFKTAHKTTTPSKRIRRLEHSIGHAKDFLEKQKALSQQTKKS